MTEPAPAAPAAPAEPAAPAAPAAPASPPAPAAPAGLKDSISDPDLQQWVETKGWQDTESMAKSALHLEKLIGAPADEVMRVPQNADADTTRQILGKLGLPESPDGYELPSGNDADPDFQTFAKGMFHEAGLTKGQAAAVAQKYDEYAAQKQQEAFDNYQASVTSGDAELQKEWGNGYERAMNLAQQAARQLGFTAELVDALEAHVGYKDTMKFMANLGQALGEDRFVNGEGDGSGFAMGRMTPAEAKSRWQAFVADPAKAAALSDKMHPNHKSVMEEKQQLFSIMYPDK